MSYFNEYQQAHMHALSVTPPEQLCWCGWHPKGECRNCPPEFSGADKLKQRCSVCGGSPTKPGSAKVIHVITCSTNGRAG